MIQRVYLSMLEGGSSLRESSTAQKTHVALSVAPQMLSKLSLTDDSILMMQYVE